MSSLLRFAAFVLVATSASAQQPTIAPGPSTSQTAAAQTNVTVTAATAQFEVSGVIKAGNMPLPGVTVSAAHSLTGKKVVTSTDVDGSYKLILPSKGKYVVRAELTAFTPQTSEVVINAGAPTHKADFSLTLLSRTPKTEDSAASQQQLAGLVSGRGTQRLSVSTDESNLSAASGNGGDTPLAGMNSLANSADATNQSFSVSGQAGNTQDFGLRSMEDFRDHIEELRASGRLQDMGGNMMIGGPGGPGGGPGPGGGGPLIIIGGPGGGGIGGGGGRMMRLNVNRPHGTLFYSAGNSLFDASPYSLSGTKTDKPDYNSGRFGAMLGGPLNIPHIYNGGTKTMFFFSYNGNRSTQPYDVFSHVPTDLERAGDFSQTVYTSGPNAGQPVQLYDPLTGALLGSNLTSISPAAQTLLNYIPRANQPGQQNYRFTSTTDNNNDNLSFRLTHNFGAAPSGPFMMGGGGGRGGRNSGRPHNSINFGGNYTRSDNDLLRPFATVGGKAKSEGINLNGGWNVGSRKITSIFRVNYNAQRSRTSNYYAGVTDIASLAGIAGVSSDPSDWGVPGLSFTDYAGLSDVVPSFRNDRVLSFNEMIMLPRKKHNFRFGADYRRQWTDVRNNTNPRGTFLFTGAATAGSGTVGSSGYDFADFLLGYAQQTTIQYSASMFQFASNAYNFFAQDDWRIRSNVTIDLGLRYEYNGPYTEQSGRLVNLAIAPGFTSAVPVQATSTANNIGSSLVNADRNNFAPRVGIAWRTKANFVLRAGYGINYNLGQYRAIAQNLAFQPPFSFTQTNTASASQLLTLANGFPSVTGVLTNNFAVDPDYRLGYVQMWNLNVQRELPKSLLLNVAYNGSKGTALDMLRAPNGTLSGLLINNAQPFLYETSQGFSILHQGTVRLRRRMKSGIAVGGTYVYSKSIDNASSIGGVGNYVAQNDRNLAAERGLSSFDQRHRFSGDFLVELPFGSGKKWLSGTNFASRFFGDWTLSGDFTLASGNPYTARILGSTSDVARGSNGSLRANYNGQSISINDSTVAQWFNTAAFTVPATGTYGTAGRNTIIGPGTALLNMAVSKSIPMRDMMGLDFRAEFTNILNHVNYAAIDTIVNSPTFGQVISVGNMRRAQLTTRFRF